MTTPRIGILSFGIALDNQSEEATKEVLALFTHLESLLQKEGETGENNSTLRVLHNYCTKSADVRKEIRAKMAATMKGCYIDTHMHVFYQLNDTNEQVSIKQVGSIAQIRYDSIVGYTTYYDDNKEYNPIIYIGELYVIPKYRTKGFFRGVLQNLMASLEKRIPLYKTDILTYSRDDIELFVSLGFTFIRPHLSETVTIKEASALSPSLIKDVNETTLPIETLMERYKPLVHPDSHLFQMMYLAPFCQTCGGPGKPALLRCNRCHTVDYCTPECQKKAWSKHKTVCTATRI